MKSRNRFILWVIALLFLLLVAFWEISKIDEPEEIQVQSESEELIEKMERAENIETEQVVLPEEDPELSQLLLPEFIAEHLNSGEEAGTLSIPVIDFEMKVLADATPGNLNRAPALMKSSHLPGNVGNAVISGHRMYEYGSHFNRIDELKIGDTLIFETTETIYEFEVEQIMVVDPSEIWITLGDQREARLTLFACTPIRIATHRIAVFAVLKQ